jgi:hypothetical protein
VRKARVEKEEEEYAIYDQWKPEVPVPTFEELVHDWDEPYGLLGFVRGDETLLEPFGLWQVLTGTTDQEYPPSANTGLDFNDDSVVVWQEGGDGVVNWGGGGGGAAVLPLLEPIPDDSDPLVPLPYQIDYPTMEEVIEELTDSMMEVQDNVRNLCYLAHRDAQDRFMQEVELALRQSHAETVVFRAVREPEPPGPPPDPAELAEAME